MLACAGIIRNDFHNLQEELVDVSFASVILADVTINEVVDLSSDVLLDEMEGIVPSGGGCSLSRPLPRVLLMDSFATEVLICISSEHLRPEISVLAPTVALRLL